MEEINDGIRVVKLLKKILSSAKRFPEYHFKKMNLTGPQGMLIGNLAHYGKMKVSDLSEKLDLANSTVSGIIDRLEKQGYVERARCKEDRRVVYVNVTSEFKKTSAENFREIERRFGEMMNSATPDEVDTIIKGLYTLEKVLERQKE